MQRRAKAGADDADANRLPGIGLEHSSGQRLGVAHTTSRSSRDRGTARRWVGDEALRGMDATTSDAGVFPTAADWIRYCTIDRLHVKPVIGGNGARRGGVRRATQASPLVSYPWRPTPASLLVSYPWRPTPASPLGPPRPRRRPGCSR